jgi:type 1 fimbria pilin
MQKKNEKLMEIKLKLPFSFHSKRQFTKCKLGIGGLLTDDESSSDIDSDSNKSYSSLNSIQVSTPPPSQNHKNHSTSNSKITCESCQRSKSIYYFGHKLYSQIQSQKSSKQKRQDHSIINEQKNDYLNVNSNSNANNTNNIQILKSNRSSIIPINNNNNNNTQTLSSNQHNLSNLYSSSSMLCNDCWIYWKKFAAYKYNYKENCNCLI